MDHDQIRDQIERILRSESLADKSQLRKLLQFLFLNMNSQTTLKPSRVIRELWPEEGSTKGSTDVATEMNRLRKAVDTYFRLEGKTDPIGISFPNRAIPGPDGEKEKRWIVAISKESAESLQVPQSLPVPPTAPSPPVRPFKSLKAILLAAIVAAFGVAAFMAARIFTAHSEPQTARIENSELVVMNADGKELWRKTFPSGFWNEYYQDGLATHLYSENGLESHLWFGDLDGDGRHEVLFLYHPAMDPKSQSTTLICYSDSGKEEWRWTPGRALAEVKEFPSVYITMGFGVLAPTKNQSRRIVVMSRHEYYFPTQIALVDSKGKTLSEYWHSGPLFHFKLTNLAGQDEVVASGISNGYLQATLLVLDPNRISGASSETTRPEVQIHGMGAPNERLRLLFTPSDLNRDLYRYNEGLAPVFSPGRIQLDVKECWLTVSNGCTIVYGFDDQFNLLSASAEDTFLNAHKAFYLKNKVDHPFNSDEEAQFQKVRCLVGCKTEFVPIKVP